MIPLNNIECRHWINTKLIHINPNWHVMPINNDGTYFAHTDIYNSIHYQALLTNNFEQYNILVNYTNQIEHSQQKFEKLYDILNLDFVKNNKIKISKKHGYILDGVHRLAILVYKNYITNNLTRDLYYYG